MSQCVRGEVEKKTRRRPCSYQTVIRWWLNVFNIPDPHLCQLHQRAKNSFSIPKREGLEVGRPCWVVSITLELLVKKSRRRQNFALH